MLDLNYGRNPWGQFFACTVDSMHAFKAGVVVHVIKTFVAGMSTRTKGVVDDLVDKIFGKHCSSETDTYPRTNFSKGCTDLKLLYAFEWAGMPLVFLVLTQTYAGRSILQSRFDDNDKKYAKHSIQQWKAKQIKKLAKAHLLRKNGHHAGFGDITEAMVESEGEEAEEVDVDKEN
jgi:hypothetical protein